MESFYRYWGKKSDKADKPYHLLPYHLLDVAAVGQVFLQQNRPLTQLFASRLGLDEEVFIHWQTFFLALHDIGKFSERFQGLCPAVQQQLQQKTIHQPYSHPHDTLGFVWLNEVLFENFAQRDDVPFNSSTTDYFDWKESVCSIWLATVCGHHGQPPQDKSETQVKEYFCEADRIAAQAFFNQCVDLLLPQETLQTPLDLKRFETHFPALSWWLAGFAVLSDWLGSNTDYFDYCTEVMPLRQYWQDHALPQASEAVKHAGMLPIAAAHTDPLSIFTYIQHPTPLQAFVHQLQLPASPQLFILEDVTGAGKTEAALLVSHKLLQAQQASGIYLGLPTMATANAMYQRVLHLANRFYADAAQPTIVLAHSASRLAEYQRLKALSEQTSIEPDYNHANADETATTMRSTWITDNRKKALLADIGVGTLDQALLAILPAKHQSLRLLGLHNKVLICDEVHACDRYMLVLLERLLHFQAFIGGSVILLSATLPQQIRQQLVNAYCGGLKIPALTLPSAHLPANTYPPYPLVTHVYEGVTGEHLEVSVATRREVQRRVTVQFFHDTEAVLTLLKNTQQQNRCACWIRNTVADACEAYQQLLELLDQDCLKDKVDLFHARFALGDRLAIEERILNYFDANSEAETRAGRILIATQVVEQSLDLDFDVLISDLAPMDLMIQRAGRLCRHVRTASGSRLRDEGAQDQRGTPVFTVVSPPLDEAPAADWYCAFFPRAARVYEEVGKLWLTAQLLQKRGSLVMPDDVRALLEGVYSEAAEQAIPQVLAEQQTKLKNEQANITSYNLKNALRLCNGYAPGDIFWNDMLPATRASLDTNTVRLARWQDGQLRPWFDDEHERFAWELSQVNVLAYLLDEKANSIDADMQVPVEHYKETVFDKGKWSYLLVLRKCKQGQWFGKATKKNGEAVSFYYDTQLGLQLGVRKAE